MACFSNLPAEIRNILYDDLWRSESDPQRRNAHELAVFTVSKQLYHESSSYFYQNNTIAIDAFSATTNCATILPPVADKYLRFLRRLTMHTLAAPPTMPRTLQVAKTITALSDAGACFIELNLLITSPLSHLLNCRVDDSVLHSTHPITVAIRKVLRSKVTETFRIQLENAWFAPGVAYAFQAEFGSQLEFFVKGNPVLDTSLLERPLIGRYSGTHLLALDLDDEDLMGINSGDEVWFGSAPSSLPSSLCSPFADLDTFSVTSFEMSSDDEEKHCDDPPIKEANADEQPFFTEEDIEEWSASTQEQDQEEEVLGMMDDLDVDCEMDDMPQEEVQAIMNNIQEVAHHVANTEDVDYMTNFAPDLLLSRHHLGHLV
ncbi:hypothetical protein GQ44DRAFT_730997 [Phaeosphaeriaceae sp. PMI808]|nr:hypothetical protein GQ44DRAFT_730997 [Phaeosphaeriaceae sp. PMI808]